MRMEEIYEWTIKKRFSEYVGNPSRTMCRKSAPLHATAIRDSLPARFKLPSGRHHEETHENI
jgi:hypothetical protein